MLREHGLDIVEECFEFIGECGEFGKFLIICKRVNMPSLNLLVLLHLEHVEEVR